VIFLDTKPSRIVELDYIRAVAMFAVIVIHVTSTYIFANSGFSFHGVNLAYFMNQAARFAVPVFILVSGASLSLSNKKESYPRFLRRRFLKIAVPYIIWCAVYLFSKYNYDWRLMFSESAGTLASRYGLGLLTGNLGSNLYFVVIILQLYIIFPALKKIKARFPKGTLAVSLVVTLYFQTANYVNDLGYIHMPLLTRGYDWELFPTWLFLFVVGMYLNRQTLDRLFAFCKKYAALIFLCFVAAAVLVTAEARFMRTPTSSIKPQLIIYAGVALFAIISLAECLSRFKIVNKIVAVLSEISFTVYFVHLPLLEKIRETALYTAGMSGMVKMLAAVTAAAFAAAFIIERLLRLVRKLV